MSIYIKKNKKVRIYLSNVTGLGATKLLQSLLPYIEKSDRFESSEICLPDSGILSEYDPISLNTQTSIFKRKLPHLLSRVLECLFPDKRYNDGTPILVLGDIPLRISKGKQVVFLQSPLLVKPWLKINKIGEIKYLISKLIFFFNLPYVNAVVVQTSVMKEKLISLFPILKNKVYVLPQPVPEWIKKEIKTDGPDVYTRDSKLNLIYPAAYYPHKNHRILRNINPSTQDWPKLKLFLTINETRNPAPMINWVHCSGQLNQNTLLKAYHDADALLFLSKEESFGFPLIEAMYLGLPIVCPDLPFARVLCGDDAIYFDPNNIESLRLGIIHLKNKLIDGWHPNWDKQIKKIPNNWATAADEMLDLFI